MEENNNNIKAEMTSSKIDNSDLLNQNNNTNENQYDNNQNVTKVTSSQPKMQYGLNYGTVTHIQDHSFYFFINPTSGSNEGQLLLNLDKKEYNFQIPNKFNKHCHHNKKEMQHYNIYFRFINLMDREQQKLGTDHIKDEIRMGQRQIYAITCGGDGTVMWVAEVLDNFKINLQDIPIGIVALGTGNDFSRALGWGPASNIKSLIRSNFKNLKKLALKWIQSNISDFDIWDSQIEVYEGGYFEVVKKVDGKAIEQKMYDKQTKQPQKILKKTFSNYLSTGIDAQIGFGFDKNRTKSRICNLLVYLCQSTKHLCKKKYIVNNEIAYIEQRKSNAGFDFQNEDEEQKQQLTQKLNAESVDSAVDGQKGYQLSKDLGQVQIEEEFQDQQQEQQQKQEEQKQTEEDLIDQIITTRTQQSFCEHKKEVKLSKKEGKEIDTDQKYLNNNLSCILMLNINSYAGGASNMWKNSSKKGAIVDKLGKPIENYRKFKKQEFSDGKIEILSYTNMVKIGFEKVISGNSDRTAQGKGPFKFNFREKNKEGKDVVTYIQIDGEYFKVIKPKQILITKSQKFHGQNYKVMVENKMFNKNQKEKDE